MGKKLLGAKFLGVFDKEKLPSLNSGLIVNKPANQHWIAIANINGKIKTFDSYGRKIINGDKLINPVAVDNDIKQRDSQKNCGPRSLAWLFETLV